MVEHFHTAPQGVAEALEAQRHDHEFLHVHRVVRVLSAVDDVHHRRGQQTGAASAQVAVQRLVGELGSRFGDGQRDAQDRVGTQILLVRRAVQFDHPQIDADLVQAVHALQFTGDGRIDVMHGLLDAFAQENALFTVTQFPRLVGTGARSAGDCRSAKGTVQ
jgi:hypothetical protein